MEALQGVDLDAAGFILVPGRRRFVPPEQLKVLLRMLPPGAMAVGVMMNPTRDEVMDWFFRADLDAVQLHGEESPEFCRWVKKILSVQVIKAFTPDEAAEKGTVEAYAPWVDSVLLDSASGGQRGGPASAFPGNGSSRSGISGTRPSVRFGWPADSIPKTWGSLWRVLLRTGSTCPAEWRRTDARTGKRSVPLWRG